MPSKIHDTRCWIPWKNAWPLILFSEILTGRPTFAKYNCIFQKNTFLKNGIHIYAFLINRELSRVELHFIVGFAHWGCNDPPKNGPGTINVKQFDKCPNHWCPRWFAENFGTLLEKKTLGHKWLKCKLFCHCIPDLTLWLSDPERVGQIERRFLYGKKHLQNQDMLKCTEKFHTSYISSLLLWSCVYAVDWLIHIG
jgi:hypothetical protein